MPAFEVVSPYKMAGDQPRQLKAVAGVSQWRGRAGAAWGYGFRKNLHHGEYH